MRTFVVHTRLEIDKAVAEADTLDRIVIHSHGDEDADLERLAYVEKALAVRRPDLYVSVQIDDTVELG